MTMPVHREPPPTPRDSALARSSGQRLARYVDAERSLRLHIRHASEEEAIELPAGAVGLLMDILETMATGRGLTLLPENAELTTVQAAAVLNVSRPFLIELLDEGAIPHRKVGTHRRIRMEDVMTFKTGIEREREMVLEALTREAQEQGHGY
ncbi:MAG: helix-turn-helix domain-containing protein [Chloroflexi bacterium]|nr:helix-turn-helix domain-containing protein [Chloroflexota bacterium]